MHWKEFFKPTIATTLKIIIAIIVGYLNLSIMSYCFGKGDATVCDIYTVNQLLFWTSFFWVPILTYVVISIIMHFVPGGMVANIILTIVVIVFIGIGVSNVLRNILEMGPPVLGVEMPGVEIPHENLSKEFECMSTSLIDSEDERIDIEINDKIQYEKLLNYKFLSSSCNDFVLPQIDFSQKTLLGLYAAEYETNRGCSIDFISQVYRNDEQKQINYSHGMAENKSCEKSGVSIINWILISKIPSDYQIK